MRHKSVSWVTLHKPKRLTTVVMMLIIWAGVSGSIFAAIYVDTSEKSSLANRASTIATTISLPDLRAVQAMGMDIDTNSSEYQRIRTTLQRVKTANSDLSHIRIIGKQEVIPHFIVDSEPSRSSYYTVSGFPHPDATSKLESIFASPRTALEGPLLDRWGFWLSAYAPIVDPTNQQVLGVVSVYAPATTYYITLGLYALIPLILAYIPYAGLVRDRKLQSKEHEITALKSQFVSIASHEIRSPITGMLWAIQSLLKQDKNLTKSQISLLTDMYNSTQSSLATVNEILDMSVFERNQKGTLQRDTVNIFYVAQEVTKTLKLGAQEKNITVIIDPDWPKDSFVTGDVTALKRAIMNVLSNAIKYSPRSASINVSYRNVDDTLHSITIEDQGIGIPEGEQEKVLQGYYRASNANKVQAHGTGLGLWMTRLIIEQHGGTISLNSNEEKGTRITLNIPIEKTTKNKS